LPEALLPSFDFTFITAIGCIGASKLRTRREAAFAALGHVVLFLTLYVRLLLGTGRRCPFGLL